MKKLPVEITDALLSSTADARLQFNCWFDGKLVAEDMKAAAFSQDFDRTRQVIGQTSVTILDDDGTLSPWGVDDPLGVAGSVLETRLVLNGYSCSLGYQRITSCSPEEVWRVHPSGLQWIPGGASVPIVAEDMTCQVVGSLFTSKESPAPGSTLKNEIRRLLTGIIDVKYDDNVVDKPIPAGITYSENRMNAIEDLVGALGCAYRLTGTGTLHVYVPSTESVWTTDGGPNGSLIHIKRSQDISNYKNIAIATRTLNTGAELAASKVETDGPLRIDGPHGRWPIRLQSDFAEDNTALFIQASKALSDASNSRVIEIPITSVFNPAIEVGDYVTFNAPLPSGESLPLKGKVNTLSYSGSYAPVSMTMNLLCAHSDVQNLSGLMRGMRWLKNDR